jgi:hypothetical protein
LAPKESNLTGGTRKIGAVVAASALLWLSAQQALAQNPAQPQAAQVSNTPQGGYILKMNSELVLTNVVVLDAKTHALVTGLKQSDFTIFENGKKQQVATFDYQSVDQATPLNQATVSGLAASAANKSVAGARPEALRNHRLIVLFFDLTTMQPEDLDRSVDAARDFLKNKM